MRRLSRILLWTAGAVLTLVLLAGLVVETSFFKSWLRGFIVRQANERLAGTLAIGRLRGNLFSGIELDDVRVMLDDQPVISIDAITSRYSIRELVSGGVTIDNVTLVHPVVAAHREGDGWQLSRLVKKDANEADRRGPSKPINIRHINITSQGHFIDKKGQESQDGRCRAGGQHPGHLTPSGAVVRLRARALHDRDRRSSLRAR
jgi:uncharacterized protein involved in outer membrane biogenesis